METTLDSEALRWVAAANSNGKISGSTISTRFNSDQKYEYVGINADKVNVAGKTDDKKSKMLRRALATVINVNKEKALEYSDDGECVVVPEAEGRIDLAQFIYEFIALSMPMTCCHEPGECDSAMMLELSKHQSTRSGAEDEEEMDSDREYGEANGESMGDEDVEPVDERWAALKKLKDKQ